MIIPMQRRAEKDSSGSGWPRLRTPKFCRFGADLTGYGAPCGLPDQVSHVDVRYRWFRWLSGAPAGRVFCQQYSQVFLSSCKFGGQPLCG